MTAQSISIHHIPLAVRGMTCMGCAATVQLALMELPGVSDVMVDLRANRAHVTFNPALVNRAQIVTAVIEAGYEVGENTSPTVPPGPEQANPISFWRRPVFFGLLGVAGLLVLYLGLVSLAEGWTHAVELLLEDAWIVGPILLGFGVQMGMYTYLKAVAHAAARGTGALAGAGGGTSTAAMVACCAHHVTDVLPLLGLSAAAAFLAEYRIPFMVVGLATNLIGIGVIGYLILRQRRQLAECELEGHHSTANTSAATCH
jgi:copper chaperone CopZ